MNRDIDDKTNDAEGHSIKRSAEATPDTEGHRMHSVSDDDDVEGHRARS